MKLKWLTLLLSFLFLPLYSHSIYDAVRAVPFEPYGMFPTESSLDVLFKENEITTVVELGSWMGASTRFFGYRVGKNGVVYAIDHWKGTPGQHGEMNDSRLSNVFQIFLSNIKQAGLANRIVPVRMTTDEAAQVLDVAADLIYIDASRDSSQVYRDIINWYPSLRSGGIICGAEYREPGVREGVMRAAAKLQLKIQTNRKRRFWLLY